MNRRKQIVVDKKFQFKTTFFFVSLVTFLIAIVLALIIANVVYNNDRIRHINGMEDNIVQYLQVKSITDKSTVEDKKAMKEIAVNHSRNIKAMNSMIYYNKILLVILIVFVLGQGIVLFFVLLRKTHQIAGPVYVMAGYIREIIDGKYPVTRKLRDRDELKDLYSLFCQMVEVLRKRDKK